MNGGTSKHDFYIRWLQLNILNICKSKTQKKCFEMKLRHTNFRQKSGTQNPLYKCVCPLYKSLNKYISLLYQDITHSKKSISSTLPRVGKVARGTHRDKILWLLQNGCHFNKKTFSRSFVNGKMVQFRFHFSTTKNIRYVMNSADTGAI